jgi:lysophospholipid acyltransferase (LPLAT)-like uncharacterized protein
MWLNSLRLVFPCNPVPNRNAVIALWHEHLPVCMRAFKNRGHGVLISRSRDGEKAARICGQWGYRVFRGSDSSGGGWGMGRLARYLKEESPHRLGGMALDGPRGPYHAVKPGTQWLSRVSGIPVYPTLVRSRFAFRLGTWDKTLLPLPFSRVEVVIGPPGHPRSPGEVGEMMAQTSRMMEKMRL